MSIETAGSLRPGTTNTPLDQRAKVNTLADISAIELPYLGQIVFCVATGKYYKITGLKPKLIGTFTVENAAVDTYEAIPVTIEEIEELFLTGGDGSNYIDITDPLDGFLVVPDETIPVSVEINNAVFPVLGMIKKDKNFKIPVAPILTAANLASYSGIWRVWRAGGKEGKRGVPGTVSFDKLTSTQKDMLKPVKGTDYWTAEDQDAIMADFVQFLETQKW